MDFVVQCVLRCAVVVVVDMLLLSCCGALVLAQHCGSGRPAGTLNIQHLAIKVVYHHAARRRAQRFA